MLNVQIQNVTHVRGGPNGENVYQVKRAAINLGKNDDRTMIAAVPGRKICVVGGQLWPLADGTLTFYTGTSATAITGVLPVDVAGGSADQQAILDFDHMRYGGFETAEGELLGVTLSANTDLDGWLLYIEV